MDDRPLIAMADTVLISFWTFCILDGPKGSRAININPTDPAIQPESQPAAGRGPCTTTLSGGTARCHAQWSQALKAPAPRKLGLFRTMAYQLAQPAFPGSAPAPQIGFVSHIRSSSPRQQRVQRSGPRELGLFGTIRHPSCRVGSARHRPRRIGFVSQNRPSAPSGQ